MSPQLFIMICLAIGTLLVIMGGLRVYHLGLKPQRDLDDKDKRTARLRKAAKRHVIWGCMWVVMGIFLLWEGVKGVSEQKAQKAHKTQNAAFIKVRAERSLKK